MLLLLFLVDYLGVDDVLVGIGGSGSGSAVTGGGAFTRSTGLGLRVDRLAQLGLGSLELLERGLDLVVVILLLQCRLEGIHVGLDLGLDLGGQLLIVVGQQLVHGVGQLLGRVADIGSLAALLVLGGVLLGLADHAVDVILGQRGAARDGHGLLGAGALVLGGDVHDAVGVDVEGNLHLGNAARGRRDAGQLKGAQRLVVPGEFTLALEDLDGDRRLVVVGGREGLGALGRDGRVALDQLGHHTALGLDAQGQRGDVDQQHVLALALEDAGLQGGADGDNLVRVHALVRLLAAGHFLDQVVHGRHAGRATDEHDVVDVGNLDAGFLDDVVERLLGALEQVGGQLLELGTAQVLVQVHRTLRGDGEVLQRDVGGGSRGQLLLGLLGCFLQALQGDLVIRQVGALGLGLLEQIVNDPLVPVVAAETVVAGGGADLDGGEVILVLADFQQRDVEGAAAEVEDQDELVFLALVEAVGQCSGGRLVDDAQDVHARDFAGFLGGLALGVIEVGRNGDHCIGDLFAQVGLGVVLQLLQDAGGNFLRSVVLAIDFLLPVSAHVALDRGDGALDVVDGLALGDLADQDLAGLGECDDGRSGAATLRVGDDGGLATFKHGNHGVGGSEVDTYCTRHTLVLS
ncbi:NAD-specific glutamate dehydrogenase [Arthrobacter crystallopoietes BAB-32]|uniref:NAD-specific glutamate dehydrogenase n=1 Tax=Arthrobacter crystallopoietes BAB-32 TaxID=1246476 RepID=N1UX39_9MICC|nr:NAD-specific glutamate dehydrogenase [Arthrobacter crystallopoietes BAB-32]